MSICLEVWGDYACFTRPEMKTERVSFDVMTPSAARGVVESIFWHPGLRWCIDSIRICAPIRFTNVRRNEVKTVIKHDTVRTAMTRGKSDLCLVTSENIQQRAALILRDVRYVIEAHFEMTDRAAPSDSPGKFQDIVQRRIRKGQFYSKPYLGCREFPAHFKPCEEIPPCPEELRGERNLGYMLWDMDYSTPENITPLFFHAVLRNGVLKVPSRDSGEVIG